MFFPFLCFEVRYLSNMKTHSNTEVLKVWHEEKKKKSCTDDIPQLHHLPTLYCIQLFQQNPSETEMRCVSLAELANQLL